MRVSGSPRAGRARARALLPTRWAEVGRRRLCDVDYDGEKKPFDFVFERRQREAGLPAGQLNGLAARRPRRLWLGRSGNGDDNDGDCEGPSHGPDRPQGKGLASVCVCCSRANTLEPSRVQQRRPAAPTSAETIEAGRYALAAPPSQPARPSARTHLNFQPPGSNFFLLPR